MPTLGKFLYQRIANKRQKPTTRFVMEDYIRPQNMPPPFDPNNFSVGDYLIEYIMDENTKIKTATVPGGTIEVGQPLVPGQQKPKSVEAPKPKYVNSDPIYKIGTIVFLLPRSNSYGPLNGNIEYPSIGSPYEIDCKITSVAKDGLYKVITGNGILLTVDHNQVTTFDKKHLFLPNSNVEVTEDTELFPAGTVFTKKNDYFVNESLEIFIHESRFVVLKTKQINLEK